MKKISRLNVNKNSGKKINCRIKRKQELMAIALVLSYGIKPI